MITLYTFGPYFGLPDPSPFVMKAEVLLKLSGLPYQINHRGLRGAPKGKLPYIDDNGQKVADSTLIRLYLERQYRIDFDAGYSAQERALAWSVEKMFEEHLYFAMVYIRWMIDANFQCGPLGFFEQVPAPMRSMVVAMIRRKVRQSLHGQGMGRHSEAEINEMAGRDLDAIATLLGDKPYLLGENACGADATVYAFLAGTFCPTFETPLRHWGERQPNLRDYVDRLHARFYPDLEPAGG
ncbi:glutathione S-transferase family protein [Crenobacter sp. SG2303]|uniref:Glutathione S-transferase family protein n=1 Tax=Crenobacter oryzisoli TaxID=3056844 RepID=A0ABT7XJT2_9NEIS|nr:glutathione S-transferase family protein [Crenobacter sp. SG2303]MDN0074035.1 glutathione S-transferase family protein [Crenobacter sp. SG2303]